MSQVVATRSIHSSLTRPTSGSALHRPPTSLKPPTFASKVLPQQRKNRCKVRYPSCRVNARKSAPAEVVPVSPADDSKVCAFSLSHCTFPCVAVKYVMGKLENLLFWMERPEMEVE